MALEEHAPHETPAAPARILFNCSVDGGAALARLQTAAAASSGVGVQATALLTRKRGAKYRRPGQVLFGYLLSSVHVCACGYWRVKLESATKEEITDFLVSRQGSPEVPLIPTPLAARAVLGGRAV